MYHSAIHSLTPRTHTATHRTHSHQLQIHKCRESICINLCSEIDNERQTEMERNKKRRKERTKTMCENGRRQSGIMCHSDVVLIIMICA